MSNIDDTIKDLLDRPIAFNPVFARIGGGAAAGAMLSQAWYWTPRTKEAADRWFYKSGEEWWQEAGLSRAELESARKSLVNRGLMEAEKRGVPCRYYYRINQDAILKAIKGESDPSPHKGSGNLKRGRSETPHSSLPETGKLISSEDDSHESAPTQFAGNRQTRMSETGKLECRKPANWIAGNRRTSLPETGELVCRFPAKIQRLHHRLHQRLHTEITTTMPRRRKPRLPRKRLLLFLCRCKGTLLSPGGVSTPPGPPSRPNRV